MMDDIYVPLYPIAMTTPNESGIYCPSNLRKVRWLPENRFERFHETMAKVSLTGDIANWQWIPAYGFGLDCWYILQNPAELLQ